MTDPTPNYIAFVGIDRSDASIDLAVLDHQARKQGHRKLSTKPNVLRDWIVSVSLTPSIQPQSDRYVRACPNDDLPNNGARS